MAVGAADAVGVHLAFEERSVFVVLVEDLAVGVIDAAGQQLRLVVVEQRLARAEVGVDRVAAGVALGTGLDLRCVVDGFEIRQAVADVAVPERRPATGQRHVNAARAVALFATDVDVGVGGVVRVRGKVVILVQVGRVALGAGSVPILGDAGPVERVVGGEAFVGRIGRRDFEPALAVSVPGDAEHLDAPLGNSTMYCCSGSMPKVYLIW